MAVPTKATLIHKLPDEILWMIFKINADMFADENALTTTRFTSQVCQSWRANITPAMWRRLIDFDSLHGLKSRNRSPQSHAESI